MRVSTACVSLSSFFSRRPVRKRCNRLSPSKGRDYTSTPTRMFETKLTVWKPVFAYVDPLLFVDAVPSFLFVYWWDRLANKDVTQPGLRTAITWGMTNEREVLLPVSHSERVAEINAEWAARGRISAGDLRSSVFAVRVYGFSHIRKIDARSWGQHALGPPSKTGANP